MAVAEVVLEAVEVMAEAALMMAVLADGSEEKVTVVVAACVVEEVEIVPAAVDGDDEDAEVEVAALAVVESLIETVASSVLNLIVEEIGVEVVVAVVVVDLVAVDLVQVVDLIDHFHHRLVLEIGAP